LRAARSRPDVGEIKISSDLAQELGSMKVYELLNANPEETYALSIN
jgi:hypothetical protein